MLGGFPLSAPAWGPHREITQAALDTLGTNHPLAQVLGAQAQALTNYCWLADYRRLPFREPEEDFYADDYLLFPGVDSHYDHICPEVKKTYRPYFQRAVQALRTENPANAARWVGSLLHFIEDTGSPPHAAELRGDVHVKMENWVDAKQISVAGYRPQLLGTNEADAREGLVRRMDRLIEFSRERGHRLIAPVQIGNRTTVKPVVLECALETSRVTADLLHTLGHIVFALSTNTTTLRGVAASTPLSGPERFPAKIILEGTAFSTLADLAGRYEFRNLPADEYHVRAFRPGSSPARAAVKMKAGETNLCRLSLPPDDGNLLRNGDFKSRWVNASAPDCWQHVRGAWEGEVIPLSMRQRYQLKANFKDAAKGDVLARWAPMLPEGLPKAEFWNLPGIKSRTLTPTNNVFNFTAGEKLGLFHVTIRGAAPDSVCDSIVLQPVNE